MNFFPKIKVLGIGGSGGNTISRMMKEGVKGVELVCLNTDVQDLKKVKADKKIQIGKRVCEGLGTGMDPEKGKKAALESKEEISKVLKDTDMVFLTYGTGGGTGSGAGPVVAELSKNCGALTVAVITKPFSFEGVFRERIAERAIEELKTRVDAFLVIENDKLLEVLNPETSVFQAFRICDSVLYQAVAGISDLILKPGFVNVDFADVRAILENSGRVFFGMGRGKGEKKGEKAVLSALHSPLLGFSCQGAKSILFNICGGDNLSLFDVEEVAKIIREQVSSQAKIIFGAFQDKKLLRDEIKITLVATGF